MDKHLDVEMTQTADRQPLAVVQNFPGLYAEMTPAQLRKLAARLCEAADECEDQPMDEKHFKAYTISFRDEG